MPGGSLPHGGETLSEYWARRERENRSNGESYLFRHAKPVEIHVHVPAQGSGSATTFGSVYAARSGTGKQPIPAGMVIIPDDGSPTAGPVTAAPGYAGRTGDIRRAIEQLDAELGGLEFENSLLRERVRSLRREAEERRGYSPDDIDTIAERVSRQLREDASKKAASSAPDIPQKREPVIVAQTSGHKSVSINGEKYGPYSGGLFEPSRTLTVKDNGDVYVAIFESSRRDENWTRRLPKISTIVTEESEH